MYRRQFVQSSLLVAATPWLWRGTSAAARTTQKSLAAVVAAWLPGTEGSGVADMLFGDFAQKGKLSFSWPRSTAQEPVDGGDANYDPLFPFGYGMDYKV